MFGSGRDADFGAHALLHEGTELALVVDLNDFLRPIGRVGDVELHLDGGCAVKTVARKLSTGEVEGFGRVDFRVPKVWCSECVWMSQRRLTEFVSALLSVANPVM